MCVEEKVSSTRVRSLASQGRAERGVAKYASAEIRLPPSGARLLFVILFFGDLCSKFARYENLNRLGLQVCEI